MSRAKNSNRISRSSHSHVGRAFKTLEYVGYDGYENSLLAADTKHPVDIFEPEAEVDETRESASSLVRSLLWCAYADNLGESGLRLTAIIHYARPDLIDAERFVTIQNEVAISCNKISRMTRQCVLLLKLLPDLPVAALIWGVQGEVLEDYGFRVHLMLHALKKGSHAGDSLQRLAKMKHCSKQRVAKLEAQFSSIFKGVLRG